MDRRAFLGTLGLLAGPLLAEAQPAGKVPRIGFLVASFASDTANARWIEAFRQGLRDLGYVEGRNIVIEYRYAGETYERLPALAAELVRLKVDVIVSSGTPGPFAAKQAISVIPIVMTSAGDPVASGLVSSLARPGDNVTGLSLMVPELGGKRMQVLKEILPGLSRIAVLWNAANPYNSLVVREMEAAATTLGVQLQSLPVRGPEDIEGALVATATGRAGALTVVEDPLTKMYGATQASRSEGQSSRGPLGASRYGRAAGESHAEGCRSRGAGARGTASNRRDARARRC